MEQQQQWLKKKQANPDNAMYCFLRYIHMYLVFKQNYLQTVLAWEIPSFVLETHKWTILFILAIMHQPAASK